MYEQSARWNEFYRELEPDRRMAMLERLCADEPDDGANDYRRLLLRARYVDEKQPGRTVDRFLFACLSFTQLWSSARMFKKHARRETLAALDEMLSDRAARYGGAGERALYWELRNAAARYLSTCRDSGYNRTLFGLVASGEDSRADRICRDIWRMTEGLAERLDLHEALRVWNCAVRDAYFASDPGAERRYRAYVDENRDVRG